MNWPRQVAGVTVLLLLVPSILGGLSVSGCKTATQVIVEPDPRVFALFAGLVAVGYGEGQADPSSTTLRGQLNEALADWTPDDLYPMTWLEENYRPDELVAATLKLGPPPDFDSDKQSLPGLQNSLATLWRDVEPLYNTNSAAESGELAAIAGPAEAAIQRAIDYAGGRAPCRAWRVVPEALALPGCAYGYRDETTDTAWVVVGRVPGSWERDLTREAFRVVVHDELARLEAEGALARFEPVLERVKPSGGLSGYVEDNLVRALTARTVDSASAEAALNEASKYGFVLAPGLYKGLADYEVSGKPLAQYLSTLLAVADVQAALALAPLSTWEEVTTPGGDGEPGDGPGAEAGVTKPAYGPELVVSGDWIIDNETVVVSSAQPIHFEQAYHSEHKIIVKNGGTLKVLASYIRSDFRYPLELYDTSTLIVEDSVLIDEQLYLSGAEIVNLDRSVVRANNSKLDLVGIGSGNRPPSYTTVFLSNCSVRQLQVDLFDVEPIVIEGLGLGVIEDYTLSSKGFKMTLHNVNITGELVSWIGNADVTFRNVDYGHISAQSGSKVTVIGSRIREIVPRITGYSGPISGLPSGSVASFQLDLPPAQGPSIHIAESFISRGWYVRYWDSDIDFRNCQISTLRPSGHNHTTVSDSVIGELRLWDTTGELHFSNSPVEWVMVMNYPGYSNDILLTGDITVQDKDWDKGLSHWGETVIRREFSFSPTTGSKHITITDEEGVVVEEFVLGDSSVKKILIFDRPQRRFKVFVDGVLRTTLMLCSDSPVSLP